MGTVSRCLRARIARSKKRSEARCHWPAATRVSREAETGLSPFSGHRVLVTPVLEKVDFMVTLNSYIKTLTTALDGVDRAAFDRVVAEVKRVYADDACMLVCGNGGSAGQ